jgi:RNA polymerase-associated protein RTF1
VKPYKIEPELLIDHHFSIKQGSSVKAMPMHLVSNGPFTDVCLPSISVSHTLIICHLQDEWRYFVSNTHNEKGKIPTRKQIHKKMEQMHKARSKALTEEDLSIMLARKNAIGSGKTSSVLSVEMKGGQLRAARRLAEDRQDWDDIARIDKELEELGPLVRVNTPIESAQDRLERVNERNRKANLDAIKKAEEKEREKKKQEKLGRNNGLLAAPVALDPSARVKTVPKLFSRASSRSVISLFCHSA